MSKERHILGISGGKDSAALAVYMSQKFPEIDMDEELADIMSDIFDWAVSSFYMVSNDTFADDMTFYSQNNYVTYEFI